MAKEKPSQGTDLISPDKIKKEPEDSGTQPVSAPKPSAASKTVTVLASPPNSSSKTSSGQPKTILLVQTVNSRTGGIQSLLLPQALRSLPATTSELSLLASRAKMSTVLTLTSSALKSQPSTAPKMAECLLTTAASGAAKPATLQSASQSQIQAQTDIKSIVKLSSAAPPNYSLPRICELTFKSRTIKADGTVCTLKEYLCNFCQFMVASQDEFREHFMTHIFSCNYCSFRAFTRFEVLSHKKEKHQGIAEELAGYEGLDSFSDQLNSMVADWKLTEMPKAISPLPAISIQVPFVSSPLPVVVTQQSVSSVAATEVTDSDSSSVLIVTPKASISQSGIQTIRTFSSSNPATVVSSSSVSVASRLHSVSTMASMTAQIVAVSSSAVSTVTPGLVAQKMTPIVTMGAVSSPVVLPMSTIKTMASVGKSNDNYFTYKIVHDATGKVQAYECDVCSYRSTKINEIFAHASTHTINDLMKSNSNNVQWECFYCSFTSILQANVVSHVIAKHPNKPIQLKRMVSNNPTQRSASRSVLFRSPNLMSDVTTPAKTSSPSIKKEKNQDEAATTLASAATVGTAAKKTDDAGDGCMWGCYYCSVQSVDRNEIILHLKKDHAQQKLVITRRRITHIPVSQSSKGDLETPETGSETVQNDSETNSTDRTSSDVQIGDIDSTDPQHSLLKSRRKQVLPRKVPDDVKNDEAGDPGKVAKPSEPAPPIGKGKRRFQNLSRSSKESVDLMELKMPEVGSGKKTRRSREVNVEGSTKRMKLNQERGKTVDLTSDVEDDATIIIDGQEGADDVGMPALEDVSNFIKLKSVNRKASTETVVPVETCITSDNSVASFVVNEVSAENDKEMPVLHPELSMSQQQPEVKSRKHPPETSTGKQPVEGANKPVDFPDDFIVNDSQLFRYNSTTSEASCRRCTFTMSGLNARNHMREHCMSHTGGQLWKCPYCPFKCGRCSMIVKHVRNKHKNRPLNAIQRKIYRRPSDNSLQADSGGTQGVVECIGTRARPMRPLSVSGLRGPRSVKENHIFEWGSHMYECPFCSRRSLFKGSIKVHVKVAHPSENNEVVLRRLPRPRLVVNSQTFSRKALLNIVPIESMHLYDSLGTLLLDNGTSLKYDLDIDDDADDNKAVVERTGLRYQCSHCNFRNLTPQVIKIHILQIHPGESTTILDHRSGCRSHHLFLCSNSDCCFATSKPEALKMHACKMLEKSVAPSGDGLVEKTATATLEICDPESQLSSNSSAGLRTHNKIQESADGDEVNSVPPSNLTKSVDTSSGESRNESSHLSVNFRKRIKTPEGPIDYNDDGTLKGVDLENGSMILQCRYCDYPRTSDPVEIKVHLAAKHPRLQPIAVDVDMKEKGVLGHLFICSIFGCDYSSRYSNVFEHHMDVEHPDVESVRSVKKKRAQKRNSDKCRIQPEVPQAEQNESLTGEPVAQENPGPDGGKSNNSDCGNKDPLPMAAIASPAASTFSQPALSPVGTVSSEASNAVGDSPAIGSPDDIQISDSPFPAKDASKPGRKPRVKGHNFDFPCRYECIQCNFRVGSPEEMKSHLVVKHSENFRNFYCIDRRARELRKRQKVIFCRDSRCGFYCKFDEELENHEKYSCSFAPSVRHHHQKATQERVLQYMDSVMKMGPGAPGIEGEKLYQVSSGSSRAAMLENVNNKMYQCSHCTFITTDLHNIRMHVIAEHASTEGGFAEIKTELGTDGNIVMNVNDRGVNELNKSAMNMNLVCDKTVDRESRSMYDAVDTVKVDDEEKVYTVL